MLSVEIYEYHYQLQIFKKINIKIKIFLRDLCKNNLTSNLQIPKLLLILKLNIGIYATVKLTRELLKLSKLKVVLI